MIAKQLSLRAIMFLGLMAFTCAASAANSSQPGDSTPIGSWFVYICPGATDACSTASPIINLTSFTKDGTTIGTDFGANPWPTPALGVWGRTGPDLFATTLVEFLSDAQSALVARVKLRGSLRYDHKSDTLAGRFEAEVTDPGGQTVLDHFEGTALLTRIQLEPLP